MYLSDNTNTISFLSNDISNVTFEKDDKIAYLIKCNGIDSVFNTTITDIDYLTLDKITISIQKPLERRQNSRFNVSLRSAISFKDASYKGLMVDLSKNGFRIISDVKLGVTDTVDVIAFLTDSEYISAKCKVVHSNVEQIDVQSGKHLYGLKIIDISSIDSDIYKYFL